MKYDVTIGIPVYNAERYIRQTMDSVLAQTFVNIEFLLVDDGGTDSSIAIVLLMLLIYIISLSDIKFWDALIVLANAYATQNFIYDLSKI